MARARGSRSTMTRPSDRHIEVTSFAELVLGLEANPTTPIRRSRRCSSRPRSPTTRSAIFATRRKRETNEPDIAMVHFVTDPSGSARDAEAETDRRAFIGRGRTIADAAAFDPGAKLGGQSGFTLDPVAALRRQVRVPANKKISLTFWTIVGSPAAPNWRRPLPSSTIPKVCPPGHAAWTRSQVQTRHLGLSLTDAANVQKLARF
jgi:cyclic beta-1,2-glucan synthetase